jgi:hypothetical protein
MTTSSLMQQALGEQWMKLPEALKAHYQASSNIDRGLLNIEYPWYMQPFLSLLNLIGALLDRRGCDIPTSVEKYMDGTRQHWRRRLTHPVAGTMCFDSIWEYEGGSMLTEYVNACLGLTMSVNLVGDTLHYEGQSFILKLAGLRIRLPEWLLGHTTIREHALNENEFEMDFRLTHPMVGQIYRYSGRFTNES